jgi:tripartite-type tricarboxylate transporter receptor subunit TctC
VTSAIALILTAGAAAQSYPSRTIRIVTAPPGGGGDLIARVLAQGMTGPMGQPVVVDNRPVGVIQGELVSHSPPDGYTLLVIAGDFWVGPFLAKLPYDPVGDFTPIIEPAESPSVLTVAPNLPINSVKELIALAKAKPGTLNYGSAGSGAANHLAAELFKAMAGVDLMRITYKGVGPALSAMAGNEVQLMFANAASAMPLVKAGKIRGIAVTSLKPSPLAPGMPTVAADLPGYEASSIFGVFAPAKTPEAIIERLNREMNAVLSRPETKERLIDAGIEAIGGTPQQLAATIKSEMAKWGKVIKDANIHID